MKRTFLEIPPVNSVFGRWKVLTLAVRIQTRLKCKCICECGVVRVVRVEALASGKSTSCGCHKNEAFHKNRHDRTIHGMSNTPEHGVWLGMISRCTNTKLKSHKDYGARGIGVCQRWTDGEGDLSGFEAFLLDIGPRPSPKHTLERQNNDEGYQPGNVVWATRLVQNRNSRRNRIVEFQGEKQPASVAIAKWGKAPSQCIYKRLRNGWRVEEALLTPSGQSR